MTELYEIAGIEIPDFFPDQPLEKVVDGNGLDWLSMINNHDVGESLHRKNCISFTNNESWHEVNRQMI